MNTIQRIKRSWSVLKKTLAIFFDKGMMTQSAALAYYAIFSLPPMLVIVVRLINQFSLDNSNTYVFEVMSSYIGEKSASALEEAITAISLFDESGWQVMLSGVLVLFTATTVFSVIQSGYNEIFEVKAELSTWQSIGQFLISRIISLSLILGLSFLLIISFALDIGLNVVKSVLVEEYISHWVFAVIGNVLIPFGLLSMFFALTFVALPDVRMSLSRVWPSALFTAFLITIGKYFISYYISTVEYDSVYSGATSFIVIMVWCYYGAAILFLGCAHLRSYLEEQDLEIKAASYSKGIQ